MKIKYFILTILLFTGRLLFAQDVKFTASVSKNEVAIDEQFEIDFKVNADASGFIPPDFGSFKILYGPNESTSVISTGAKTTTSKLYNYTLIGTKEGGFTIGAATIVVNGNRLNTNAIKLNVIKAPAGLKQQNEEQQTSISNVGTVPGTAGNGSSDKKFTASLTAGAGNAFKITFSVNGSGDNFIPPDFKGVKVIDGPNQSTSVEVIKGVTSSVTSYTYDLKATTDGEFVIGTAMIEVDGLRVASSPLKIKIKNGTLQLKK